MTRATDKPITFVAELSGNHNNDLDRAHAILEAVAGAGASAIKLQTYTPDTMTLRVDRDEFRVAGTNELWGGRHLYDLYSEAMTPWEWHDEIFSHARELGLQPFSSPFDRSAVDFLESLDCPMYKIASFEIVDLELIKYAASTTKPLIISTGMASIREISEAVEAAETGGATEITLLKATSAYPARAEHANLMTLSTLKEVFGYPVGVSDHTMGIGVPIAAVALGASVVEKHVTLNRSDGGVDADFSLEPSEFAAMVIECNRAQAAIGCSKFGPTEGEARTMKLRRSLILAADVNEGDLVSKENIQALRPAGGMPVSNFPIIEGMRFARSYSMGTMVAAEMFKQQTGEEVR